jgi:hypothetical protein
MDWLTSRLTICGSDERQLGKRTPWTRSSFAQSRHEFAGRLAGVG